MPLLSLALAGLLALPAAAQEPDRRSAATLIEVYKTSKDATERAKAVSTMGNFQNPSLEILKTLVLALGDQDWFVRAAATGSLRGYGAKASSVIPDLIKLSAGPDDEFAIHALKVLADV